MTFRRFWYKGPGYHWWMRFLPAANLSTSGCFDDACDADNWKAPGQSDAFLSNVECCKCNRWGATQKALSSGGFIPVAFTAAIGTLWHNPQTNALVQERHNFGR